ncbi:MAG: paraquat-inducible protein A [Anaerolineae bacterium]|nr:paraquat-inducible protein A [Phycisphaerae bacterium]
MSESIAQSALVRCRRCRRRYELPATRSIFRACPHCGAAPLPLWRRIGRHNGVAAILCIAALIVLSAAVVMPFISMSKLGEVRIFSLISGIGELFDRGQWVIGTVLFVFSLIFPFAKLLALLAATSSLTRMSAIARRRLHHLAMLTGKYSLLDIMVVAIMIVLVKFQGIAEVRAQPGTVLFCVAILLSILAGVFVDLRNVDVEESSANE